MSDTAMVTPLLNVLLPVIVGGAIGIVAGLIGPYFIQRAKDAAERKRKRAEKFEELVAAVVEHGHWLDALRNIRGLGVGSELGFATEITLSPMAKIHAICAT